MGAEAEFLREDGRRSDQVRELKIELNYIKWAEGSCLVSLGDTRVICTASLLNTVPAFAKEKGIGWIFAEYSMLPRSVDVRTSRVQSGRSFEIQRIIGRSLRAVCDLKLLQERVVAIDCDVIQADGSTRCASIIGGFVSLFLALYRLWKDGVFITFPISQFVSAVSCGVVNGLKMVDLTYKEDSSAECDITVISTSRGYLVEVHGGVENGGLITKKDFDELVEMGISANMKFIDIQKKVLEPYIKELKLNF
jgi:ribonuclease PH